MLNLTPKQKQVLDFINEFTREKEYPPSLAEIAKEFKKSIPTIFQFVETLKNKGFLTKQEDVARGIYTQKPEIFLMGKIAAGEPIEPLENPEPIQVPNEMIMSPGNYYALQVKGDSMIDEGILDGDIIVVKHQNTVDNGDVVVAIIKSRTGEGATLKKFYLKGDKIELRPRNQKLKSKFYNASDINVRGKFIGLLKKP